MSANLPPIRFPVTQQESARQTDAECLLARDVFQRIAELLAQQLHALELARKENRLDQLDDCRTHQAILIDGPRGSGKSTVLVNLDVYLGSKLYQQHMPWPDTLGAPRVAIDQLLILKPVDPTLLDDGDDLLLNVIVAALVRNPEVKKKLDAGGAQAENFYHKLQQLGGMLESLQGQHKAYGLDKLRTFLGGHGLAQVIHELFACALALTGRKLIVLPIDDVDTSLEHAYSSLEILRKYLATPYVITIVSGDLTLYKAVIMPHFHKKLMQNAPSQPEKKGEESRAEDLVNRYLQKVLPHSRSLAMPVFDKLIEKYNFELILQQTASPVQFSSVVIWIELILNGAYSPYTSRRVLNPAVDTTRSFTQLLNKLSSVIHTTPNFPDINANYSIHSEHIKIDLETEWQWLTLLKDLFSFRNDAKEQTNILNDWISYHPCRETQNTIPDNDFYYAHISNCLAGTDQAPDELNQSSSLSSIFARREENDYRGVTYCMLDPDNAAPLFEQYIHTETEEELGHIFKNLIAKDIEEANYQFKPIKSVEALENNFFILASMLGKIEATNQGLCLRSTIKTENFILTLVYSLITKRIDDNMIVRHIWPIKTYGAVEFRLDDWQRNIKYTAENLSSQIRRWRRDMGNISIPSAIIRRIVALNNRAPLAAYTNKDNSQANLFRFTRCLYVFLQELIWTLTQLDIGNADYSHDLASKELHAPPILHASFNSTLHIYRYTKEILQSAPSIALHRSIALKVLFHPVVSTILQVHDLFSASLPGLDYLAEENFKNFGFDWKKTREEILSTEHSPKEYRAAINTQYEKIKPAIEKIKLSCDGDTAVLDALLLKESSHTVNHIKHPITRPSDTIYNLLLINRLRDSL